MGVLLLPAQQTSKAGASRLRALALLEVSGTGRARLVPIALKVGDKFYDANLYRADPRPLALDPGVVYEAERAGDSVGLFTVTQAQRLKDRWLGLGTWRLNSALELEKKAVKEPPPVVRDERPVLRRPKSTSPEPSATGSPAPSPSPAATPSPAASPAPTPAPTPAPVRSAAPSSVENDPSRPVLRRGKPTARQDSDELPPEIEGKPGTVHSTPGVASAVVSGSPADAVEVLPAISDAAGPKPHPFVMNLSSEERSKYDHSLRQMAYEAVVRFAAVRPPHKPGPADRIADVQFQVYDSHDNNEPDFVFSASFPEQLPRDASSPFRYFATVVARVDMYGDMHTLLASVTDSTHLDAYPRLELIDMVDADGSGSGQLLFRRAGDGDYDYVLYRLGLDKLWPLFEGAGSAGR
jgi:hypothetical protein